MAGEAKIAIVEDDPEIRDLVANYLRKEGFAPRPCANAGELDAVLAAETPDLIVLDIMMPGEDGLSICRRLNGAAPVIILSAKGEDLDKIIGLEVGADDYLAKPFNPRELVARIRAVLRRAESGPSAHGPEAALGEETAGADAPEPSRDVYLFEGWRFDLDAHTLTNPDGEETVLSGGEFALLREFIRRPKRVLSRDDLLEWTRGREAEAFDRSVDVQLSRLRRKLGEDPRAPALIRTVRGGGYMFTAAVHREPGR